MGLTRIRWVTIFLRGEQKNRKTKKTEKTGKKITEKTESRKNQINRLKNHKKIPVRFRFPKSETD
jgi:hypothetical protein